MQRNSHKRVQRIISALTVILLLALLAGCGANTGATDECLTEKITAPEGATVVSNAREFLQAVKPGATIYLKPGKYDLAKFQIEVMTEGTSKWELAGNEYTSVVDPQWKYGQITIFNVDGLRICGESAATTTLIMTDETQPVLCFQNCTNLQVDHLTMGHSTEGNCSGSVASFSNCSGVTLSNLDLYGCGTFGTEISECHGFDIKDSVIRDCSDGCITVIGSSDINYRSVQFRNNKGYSHLNCYYAETYFENCSFSGTGTDKTAFFSEGYGSSYYFRGCSFGEWECGKISSQSNMGNAVFDDTCKFEKKVSVRPVAVSSVQELFSAIKTGAMIIVEPGRYNLSEWLEPAFRGDIKEWTGSNENVELVEYYDGIGPLLKDLANVSIVGRTGKAQDVVFEIEPRYAHVFAMNNCYGVTFRGITMGHTETGDCNGNVVDLDLCGDVILADTDLYGCGVEGIYAYDITNLYMYNSAVHDCSWSAVDIASCYGQALFYGSEFYGSEGMYFNYDTESDIRFYDCSFGLRESYDVYWSDFVESFRCRWDDDFDPDDQMEYVEYDPFPSGAFRTELSVVRFDAMVLQYTNWDGTWQSLPEEGVDEILPIYKEGELYETRLCFSKTDLATLERTGQDPFEFTWKMDDSYYMAICLDDSGAQIGTITVYANKTMDESPIFVLLFLNGNNYWFRMGSPK